MLWREKDLRLGCRDKLSLALEDWVAVESWFFSVGHDFIVDIWGGSDREGVAHMCFF